MVSTSNVKDGGNIMNENEQKAKSIADQKKRIRERYMFMLVIVWETKANQ